MAQVLDRHCKSIIVLGFFAHQSDKKQAWEMMCRVKPDLVKDREVEKALQRTATRCVIVYFCVVTRK